MADKANAGPGTETAAGASAAEVSNEALLAELQAEGGKAAPAAPAKPAAKPAAKTPAAAVDEDKPASGALPDEDDEDDEDNAAPVESDDDETDEEDDPDDGAADDEAPEDPALAKRIAAVRKFEQRQRAKLAVDRAVLEQERTQFRAESKKRDDDHQRFERLAARAKYDSYSVLRELGVTDDDMELHAQQLYARSKSAAGKPEYRAAADRALRDREVADKASTAEQRVADLEKKLAARDQETVIQRELDVYFDRAIRKVTDETPRTKALIAKSPKRARQELAGTALELSNKLGGAMPKPAQLLAAHEKKIVRQLRRYGVEDAAHAPDAAPAPKPVAGKKPAVAAKSGAKPAAKVDPADPPVNGEVHIPSRDELLRELAAGDN